MTTSTDKSGCVARSWRLAAYGGITVAVLFMVFGGSGLFQALIAGAVFGGVLGFALTRFMCPEGTGEETVPEVREEQSPAPAAEPEPAAAAPAQEPEPEATSEPEAPPSAPAAAADPVSASPLVKPSKVLPGQQELAARKGTWRFEGNNAA